MRADRLQTRNVCEVSEIFQICLPERSHPKALYLQWNENGVCKT